MSWSVSMRATIFVFFLATVLFSISNRWVHAEEKYDFSHDELSIVIPDVLPLSVVSEDEKATAPVITSLDLRPYALAAYLKSYDSPLSEHAWELMDAATENNIDWKLVAAISGVESGFGKRIPGGHESESTSYNAWGWGVYGEKRLGFSSWKEGINKVSKGLKDRFIDLGLNTPEKMNPKYASNPDWGWQVQFFLSEIDGYFRDYLTQNKSLLAEFDNHTKDETQVIQQLQPVQQFDHTGIFFSAAWLKVTDYNLELQFQEY